MPDSFPDWIVHADWSKAARKRWMAKAVRQPDGSYQAQPAEPVGTLENFLSGLRQEAGSQACILIGFDFPIGLPAAYARRAGIDSFLTVLPAFGQPGVWQDFYSVAAAPSEISLHRPFYPASPGRSSREDLRKAHGLSFEQLRRTCEYKNEHRQAACPLFWTLGGQQVGKAAITGWHCVLAPGLRQPDSSLRIWPFAGDLPNLLRPGAMVAAETYPAEYYTRLGIDLFASQNQNLEADQSSAPRRGKRSQAARRSNADALLEWSRSNRVQLQPALLGNILDGFGVSQSGEDRFDAVVGLLGMIETVCADPSVDAPFDAQVRQVEG